MPSEKTREIIPTRNRDFSGTLSRSGVDGEPKITHAPARSSLYLSRRAEHRSGERNTVHAIPPNARVARIGLAATMN
jgi:hypothetical protein